MWQAGTCPTSTRPPPHWAPGHGASDPTPALPPGTQRAWYPDCPCAPSDPAVRTWHHPDPRLSHMYTHSPPFHLSSTNPPTDSHRSSTRFTSPGPPRHDASEHLASSSSSPHGSDLLAPLTCAHSWRWCTSFAVDSLATTSSLALQLVAGDHVVLKFSLRSSLRVQSPCSTQKDRPL